MKPAVILACLALLALSVVALQPSPACAADKHLCTIVSTENISRTMRDAGPGTGGPACPTATDIRSSRHAKIAVQCNTSACIATGTGTAITAACAYDGGADLIGVQVQANSVYDVPFASGDDNLATISPNGSGTSTCRVFSVTP